MPKLFNSLSIVCLFALTVAALPQRQQQQIVTVAQTAATATSGATIATTTTSTYLTSTATFIDGQTQTATTKGIQQPQPGGAETSNMPPQHQQQQPQSPRNGFAQMSALDKEVVERLIKQWAPIVWLAPEEKFLPLGVEEFLNHVHPMDKDKSFTPGVRFSDYSTKSYLVTNAQVDDLLENEDSFLYGRNPNESRVPIYGVVTLCNNQQNKQPSSPPQAIDEPNKSLPPLSPMRTPVNAMEQPVSLSSTRGPYIPVSIDPLDERNNTIRRSSRLYPVFQRVKRDASTTGSDETLAAPATGGASELELEYMPFPPAYELPSATDDGSNSAAIDSANSAGSSFIANLADNVKFSGDVDDDVAELQSNSINDQPPPSSFYQSTNRKQRKVPSFHVTYWMFYPYSQGKTMCTVSLGPLGRIPFPAVYGYCLGRRKDIGSHIGDWEHMSLYFNGDTEPEAMYVSAHDAGAYYSYNRLTGSFEFKKQETRKGILQRPNFPKTVTTFNNHPVLFAAKGSHGLWTAPGKHRFVKVARLYDINGFGTPWNTWKAVDISYENLKSYGRSLIPDWLTFRGKWGNPKSKCHPFRRIGLNFCEFTDGPTGIPLKEPHFECGATYR